MSKHCGVTRSTARGYVQQGPRNTWTAHVVDSTGKVVWSDNTCGKNAQLRMLNEAAEAVQAIRRIENMGHRLALSWSEVVVACKGVA